MGAVFYEAVTGAKFADTHKNKIDPGTEILRYGKFYNPKILNSIVRALQADPEGRFDSADLLAENARVEAGAGDLASVDEARSDESR